MPAYPAFSNDEMIFQSELDKKCPDKMSPEDKILSDKIDEWGKKTFGMEPDEFSPESVIGEDSFKKRIFDDIEDKQIGESDTTNINLDFTNEAGR